MNATGFYYAGTGSIRNSKRFSGGKLGFTLLETLIVIAIIAVLVGIAVPAIQRVRDLAARAACASNLRQLATGVHLFADVRQQLPQGCDFPFLHSPRDLGWQAGISWHTSILPFVEQEPLWKAAWEAHVQDPSGETPAHMSVRANTIRLYRCPSDPRELGGFPTGTPWGLASYVGVAGTHVRANDGVFHRNFSVRFGDITDGTSNTLMIGERPPGPNGIFGSWYADWGSTICQLSQIFGAEKNAWVPYQATDCEFWGGWFRPGRFEDACDVNHFWSLHAGGANFSFADGSVRFLSYARSELMPALATRAGGEIVNVD
jgi:prepilin-type N-terminal cleavage/methylation domain-containing protein/prepilin-type processing-associated H-X9-DG protein